MAGRSPYVTPGEMFHNWGELTKKQKIALEEDQYRKQLYVKTYGD